MNKEQLAQLSEQCKNCARFPGRIELHGVTKMDVFCPIKKNEEGKYSITAFSGTEPCEKFFKDTEPIITEIEQPETPTKEGEEPTVEEDEYMPVCFIDQKRGCYEGCALFNKENDLCQVYLALESFMDKTETEKQFQLALAEQQGIKLGGE